MFGMDKDNSQCTYVTVYFISVIAKLQTLFDGSKINGREKAAVSIQFIHI